jgi:phage shock protein A
MGRVGKLEGRAEQKGQRMSLFERLGNVFLDELTNIISPSVSPEEEIERYISQKRSTAMAINMAIGKVPAKQAKILEKQLAVLKVELSEAEAKRDALMRRKNRANNGLQVATGAVKNPFERMEEKVKEAEEAYQAASDIVEQQNVRNMDLDQQFAKLEADGDHSFSAS